MSSCGCGVPQCQGFGNFREERTPLISPKTIRDQVLRDIEITDANGNTTKIEGATIEVEFDTASVPFYGEGGEDVTEPQLADWEKIAERRQDDAVVYISGPMRGYPEHNYPAFNEAASVLDSYGYKVVNPADNFQGRVDLPQETYLRVDVGVMAERCNAIFFLPGWQNSAGARLEWQVAKSLGFDVVNDEIEGDETDVNLPVEYEASSIVRNGERQMNYGHPNQDFARTAGMWTAFLAHKLVPGEVITMEEMALMMGQLKMSRLASTPGHHDSIVDLIGYAICYDRLGETE